MTTKRSELKEFPHSRNSVNLNAAIREVKMVEPIHDECQREFKGARGWYKVCLERGHDPYITKTEIVKSVPVREEQEDGTILITGTREIVETTERLNVTGVPLTLRVNSGRGIERARERGFKDIIEFGYKPMCQFRGCEAPSKVTTEFGEYCSDEHARLIAADELGITLEVGDLTKRRTQLRGIDVGRA